MGDGSKQQRKATLKQCFIQSTLGVKTLVFA